MKRMDDKHCECVDADCATRQKLARITNKTKVTIRMDELGYDRTGQDRTGQDKTRQVKLAGHAISQLRFIKYSYLVNVRVASIRWIGDSEEYSVHKKIYEH